MMIALYILFSLLLIYAGILLWLASGFMRTPNFWPQQDDEQTAATIIICARNEEKHIGPCLSSLLRQDYDLQKIQLLLINDASSDRTVFLAESILKKSNINYRIISNPQQKGKKQSIMYAMQFAVNPLIVLRDSDTFTTSANWLMSISEFYQTNKADMIIAPVAIADNVGALWALQAIENNVLAVMAAGSCFYKKPFLCNGANLIFTKELFEKTKGYTSHLEHLSGDDIFFLEDAKKIPGTHISYLKSPHAVVSTYPAYSFGQLLQQKIRWASKFKSNRNPLNFLLALLSFAVNAGWLLCFAICFFNAQLQPAGMLFVFLKLLIDFLLLFLASGFIKNKQLWWYSLPVGCVYPLYACIVALASIFIKPRWKL